MRKNVEEMGNRISEEMEGLFDEVQAKHLAKFFKTGKGEYGEDDKFLGIKVPVTREIVKGYRKEIGLEDVTELINSEWHEVRLAGLLLLVELYKTVKSKNQQAAQSYVEYYLTNLDKGNNWDLVDLIAPNILGDWVSRNPEEEGVLFELANKTGLLWHQRVAIVSTLTMIKEGRFDPTFQIAEIYLFHPHDLIHKATGWMLREIGKRGGKNELVEFLNRHKSTMPRTMLRYAIEKFPEEERQHFMKKE